MANDLRERLQASLREQYVLGRELPRGGMSRVFVATENALGREVVIKVLAPDLSASLSVERFKREIKLAARLQHPHIVPLLSAGQAEESLYFTMPLIRGESLRDRMSRVRPMPIVDVARTMAEVAGALEYAHAQGIVHRDIKPENIMYFHEQAVVLDFGIGKALTAATGDGSRPSAGRITQGGMSLGTPMYISPEQAAGDPDLDQRADLYSLGVVAYEMLCGHPPFSGRTVEAVLSAHARNAPESIRQRRPETPAPLAEIIMKCLQKDPADRPQTAGDIARVMHATPQQPMPAIPVPGMIPRVPRWLPWAIAAISAGAAGWFALNSRVR